MDGLLLESEDSWTVAETALFARYGKSFGLDEKRALLGNAGDALGRILERMLDQPGRGLELPAPVLGDLDGAHVVALGVEGIDDGASGRDRDVVLARAPAHDHRHPDSGHRLRTYKRRC